MFSNGQIPTRITSQFSSDRSSMTPRSSTWNRFLKGSSAQGKGGGCGEISANQNQPTNNQVYWIPQYSPYILMFLKDW